MLCPTCTHNTQSLDDLTGLAQTGVHLPVALSTQTLHAPGLPLTLVLLTPVQTHEPGHQLWLICAPFVPRRAASCLPSNCGPALAQANQQTSPPSRLQLYLFHQGWNISLRGIPPLPSKFVHPFSSALQDRVLFYFIVTLSQCKSCLYETSPISSLYGLCLVIKLILMEPVQHPNEGCGHHHPNPLVNVPHSRQHNVMVTPDVMQHKHHVIAYKAFLPKMFNQNLITSLDLTVTGNTGYDIEKS